MSKQRLARLARLIEHDMREHLGRLVRDTWIAWARQQPDPKPSWLVSWEELSEPEREVDRLIGVRLYLAGLGQWVGPTADFVPPQSLAEYAVKGLSDERFTATADEAQTDECPIRLGRGEL